MVVKKRGTKPPAARVKRPATSPAGIAPADTELGRMRILLEVMDTSLRALAEGLVATREELKADLRALEERLTVRLEVVEAVCRQNSRDIQQNTRDIQQNSRDIQQNTLDIQQNTLDIQQNSRDIQQNTLDIRNLTGRVERLERSVASLEASVVTRIEHEALVSRVSRLEGGGSA